jgi:hypothetical protein
VPSLRVFASSCAGGVAHKEAAVGVTVEEEAALGAAGAGADDDDETPNDVAEDGVRDSDGDSGVDAICCLCEHQHVCDNVSDF